MDTSYIDESTDMIFVHVDVDNLWNYEKEYGISFGKDEAYIFEDALPRALEFFAKHNIRATFFIVGRDLELESARKFCRDALAFGHAIANHTYSHDALFCEMSYEEKASEIQRCHRAIKDATGYVPVGFRAPGYFFDDNTAKALLSLDYKYDSSVLPGLGVLIMKAYNFVKGDGRSKGKRFGRARYLFASRRPKPPVFNGVNLGLLNLPISVAPMLRLPSHSTFIYTLGGRYFSLLKRLYKMSPREHVYLFHAIDFADLDNASKSLGVVPSLRLSLGERMSINNEICSMLNECSEGPINTTESRFFNSVMCD